MIDFSVSQKQQIDILKEHLARVENGEVFASNHPGPYTDEEKTKEIGRIKAHIRSIEEAPPSPPHVEASNGYVDGYVQPGYVGPATPIPPTEDNPPDEAGGEYVAQAVEFWPGAEDTENAAKTSVDVPLEGVRSTAQAGSFTPSVSVPLTGVEATLGGEGSLKANAGVVHNVSIVETLGVADGFGTASERSAFDLRLSERPDDISNAARHLAAAVKDQIEDLKQSSFGVNDREKIDEFVNFLEGLATGLNQLADALDRMVEKAKGSNEPFFTEDAAKIARELGAYVTKFAEDHPHVTQFSTRIGLSLAAYKFLLLFGVNELAIGGFITAILAKGPYKKK